MQKGKSAEHVARGNMEKLAHIKLMDSPQIVTPLRTIYPLYTSFGIYTRTLTSYK